MNSIDIIGIWLAESSAKVVLSLDRCLNAAAPELVKLLFGYEEVEVRAWLVTVAPSMWGLIYFIGQMPYFISTSQNHNLSYVYNMQLPLPNVSRFSIFFKKPKTLKSFQKSNLF